MSSPFYKQFKQTGGLYGPQATPAGQPQMPQAGGQPQQRPAVDAGLVGALKEMLPQIFQQQKDVMTQNNQQSRIRQHHRNNMRSGGLEGYYELNPQMRGMTGQQANDAARGQGANNATFFENSPAHVDALTAMGQIPKAQPVNMQQNPEVFGLNPEGGAQNVQGDGWGLMLGTGPNAMGNPSMQPTLINPQENVDYMQRVRDEFAPVPQVPQGLSNDPNEVFGPGFNTDPVPVLPGPMESGLSNLLHFVSMGKLGQMPSQPSPKPQTKKTSSKLPAGKSRN